VQTEFLEGNSTWTNSIVVAFTRPVTLFSKTNLDEDDLSVRVLTRDGGSKPILWKTRIYG